MYGESTRLHTGEREEGREKGDDKNLQKCGTCLALHCVALHCIKDIIYVIFKCFEDTFKHL